ncbi:tripartite motif-containing protein 2-like [Saccostrea cucullata]|uniref:tripartite motif-containing protein 2-like n=1 Tax=Saccostrea cuccullata TaxID=36930 RepID=UPI002ED3C6A9
MTAQQRGRSAHLVIKLLEEPKIVTSIDTGFKSLFNLASLSDEEIWTSGNDNAIKLFNMKERFLINSIRTKSGKMPWDIAVTQNGELVYSDINERSLNLAKNSKIKEVIKLKTWEPRDICSTAAGHLLVMLMRIDGRQSKVVRYHGSEEKQSIQFDDDGNSLYSTEGYRYINENRNLDICVTDSGVRVVVVVNQAGKLRYRYMGNDPLLKQNPFDPRGIASDNQSNILIADFNNHCIHLIDQDGQFLRYIKCGLDSPWGLCADKNGNLFVAQSKKRQVTKIKYLEFITNYY